MQTGRTVAAHHTGSAARAAAGRRRLALLALALILLPGAARAWKLESDAVTLPAVAAGSTAFVTVNLRQTYPGTPLIFVLPAGENPAPDALRIRNVTASSFEIVQVEPPDEDGVQPATTIHYLAVEPGSHQLPEGTWLEGGTVSTTRVQHGSGVGGGESWEQVGFTAPVGANPVVLADIQTMANEAGSPPGGVSFPWLTVSVQNADASAVDLALERSEVNDGGGGGAVSSPETVAYLAIQGGRQDSFTDSGRASVVFETLRSATNIDGTLGRCTTVGFGAGFSAAPLVLAHANTHIGGDGGWMRRCSLDASGIGLVHIEDRDRDSDGYHISEGAGVAAFSQAFDADVTPPPPTTPDSRWAMEAGEVNLPAVGAGDTAFRAVAFQQEYAGPPVVLLLPADDDPQPAALRIRNVTTTGFELAPVEPQGEDGAQPATSVHYFAIEPGLHQLPGGTVIAAGTIDTTRTQAPLAGSTGWDSVSFVTAFASTPAVVAQVQTMNNESGAPPGAPSRPWLTTTVEAVTGGGFAVALERAETTAGAVSAAETVGYVAVAGGASETFTDAGGTTVTFEAIRSAQNVRGWSNGCFTVPFANTYSGPPLVVAAQNTRNGNNGGWLRRCALSATAVGLTVDEDQAADSERSHIGEIAGALVFSGPFVMSKQPIAEYRMDEPGWSGGPGEVIDGAGSYDATAHNGAATANATPALAGSPGTCGYGAFNGRDHYVELPAGFPDLTGSFTITAWIRAARINQDQRIFADDANNSGGYAFSLGDGCNGCLRFFSRGLGGDAILDSPAVISRDTWYHVSAVHDAGAKRRLIYVNGALVAQDAGAYSGAWGTDPGPASIGGEVDGTSESTPNWRFDGDIDELRVYDWALEQTEIQSAMNDAHACTAPGVDHYRILHDGSALTCQPEGVTVQACLDTDCTAQYAGTVDVSLSPSGWVGGDAQSFSGGSAALELRQTTPGTATLGIASATPSAANPPRCFDSGVEGSCDVTFNESGFAFDVPNQVSCTASGVVTVAAVRVSDAGEQCVPAFANTTKTVDLWSSYVSPATPVNPRPLSVNGTVIAGAGPGTPLSLAFDANGEAQITVRYDEAGALQLDARYVGSGDEAGLVMTGSDGFVVRPDRFFLRATTDGSTDLDNAAASGDPKWQAARDYRMQLRAACADGTVTRNYQPGNAELFVEMVNPPEGAGVQAGSLELKGSAFAGSFASAPNWQGVGALFTEGVVVDGGQDTADPASYASAAFSEVGVVDVHVRDSSYLGTAVPENTLTVGRFMPARFAVSDNGPSFRDATAPWGCGFSYLGQPFGYSTEPQLTVQALNADGAVTANYAGPFWKLAGNPLNSRAYTDVSGARLGVSQGTVGSTSITGPSAGVARYDLTGETLVYARSERAPLDAQVDLALSPASLTDSDGVCYSTAASVCSVGEGSVVEGYTMAAVTGTNLRFGRLRLLNAVGPELLDLNIPARVEYYQDGADRFVVHTDDSCTNPVTLALSDADPADNLDVGAGETCVWDDAGASGAGCPPAGPGGEQYAAPPAAGDLNLWLRAPGAGNDGSVGLRATPPGWLQYNWNGAGPEDPGARGTFGVYRGEQGIIFQREVY